jgi:hypothetical protein
MMVEVAVIGAGAAGLTTARHLLRCGLSACLFESRLHVGGAWAGSVNVNKPSSCDSSAGYHPQVRRPQMWDNLTPNLSKYTCSFSDFPWPQGTPTFPSLADMNRYLEAYADKYVLNDDSCTVNYGCTVAQVSSTGGSDQARYKVEWVDKGGVLQSHDFDGVVVATGFFSSPVWPECLLEILEEESNESKDSPAILHSSEYTSPAGFATQTVAVIGGLSSAHEIAADVRRHAKRVVNVIGNQVPYVLPRCVPASDENLGGFLPLDYVFYRRGDDAVAPKAPEQTKLDKSDCRRRHEYLRSLIGSRKLAQAASHGFPSLDPSSLELPPFISISDDYLDLVVDGKIEVFKGRLAGASAVPSASNTRRKFDLELEDGTVLKGFDRVISCTGYRTRLDFLSSDILKAIEYDESDQFAPFSLVYETVHPQLTDFGFVGMYKGAYFGVMELQARLVAGLISRQVGPLSEQTIASELSKSRNIRRYRPRSQFPRFDYIGMMDGIAHLIDLAPKPATFGAKGIMVVPAFYQPSEDISRELQERLEEDVHKLCHEIPRAVVSALVGKWSFERSINDRISGAIQRVHGEIGYSLQEPHFKSLRYREDGFLELPGTRLEVFREYDYLCKNGALEIYFVENGERTYLFLSLRFEKQEEGFWVASSDHLCVKDLYKGSFKMSFDGTAASEVSMTYRVKGPNKDYESVTFLRPIA